jgi:N-acetylneuraminate synthase
MVSIIAEIGINHNGSLDLCKELMKIAKDAGCDYVKIQKRNPDICVPESQKHLPKETPWGSMTYLEYKKRLEFDEKQLEELFSYAKELNISFFASVWDKDSCDVMKKFTSIGKIPSALLTDLELCAYARKSFDTLILSTGMSSEEEIEKCIEVCKPDVIMHTNSTYPCPPEDLNLNYILWLKEKYPLAQIGYSGHEFGLVTTFAAVALGSTWVERHITKDRTMWGSDQTSSIEPNGLTKLVKGIRDIELATQFPPAPRIEFPKEEKKKISLRK